MEQAAERKKRAEKEQAEKAKEPVTSSEQITGNGEQVSPETETAATNANLPEEEVRLETEKVSFVLTNKGGGIKYAEFKDQKAVVVHSERKKLSKEELATPELVHLNRFGDAAVGSLVNGGVNKYLGLTYKLVKSDAESVTFSAIAPNGLSIAKKWSLVKVCLLYTSPSPRDKRQSRMPSSA